MTERNTSTSPADGALPAVPRAPVFLALGQFALLALVPRSATAPLAAAELALLVAFGLTLVRTAAPLRALGAYAVLTVSLFGLAVAGQRAWGMWGGTALLVVLAALLAYGMHRYELVALDRIGGGGG